MKQYLNVLMSLKKREAHKYINNPNLVSISIPIFKHFPGKLSLVIVYVFIFLKNLKMKLHFRDTSFLERSCRLSCLHSVMLCIDEFRSRRKKSFYFGKINITVIICRNITVNLK